jgi:NCS1 family nucleobase:cation symporter-1
MRLSGEGVEFPTDKDVTGRLPVLLTHRLYKNYGAILLTWAVLTASSASYLVGNSLVSIGSTRVGIAGYLLGMIVGQAIITVAGGALPFRYGVDTVDASKSVLGVRGSLIMLIGTLVCTIGWCMVILAMTTRITADLLVGACHASWCPDHETQVVMFAFIALTVIWLVLRQGAGWMERFANSCALVQFAVAAILLGCIAHRFGIAKPWHTDIAPDSAYTHDRALQFAYAFEFGMCNSVGLLPFIGGLTRLVQSARHVVGPSVLGYGVVGALIATVAALGTAATGHSDFTGSVLAIAGPNVGRWLLGLVVLTNVGTMVAQIYLSAISVQQIRIFAQIRWALVVAAVLLPGVFVAFESKWVIAHVMNWLAYNGILFIGMAAVLFVDFAILRHLKLVPAALFAAEPQEYWFWGGVNWIALLAVLFATGAYLYLFNPVSLKVGWVFRYCGASLPVFLATSLLYYTIIRSVAFRLRIGGYVKNVDVLPPISVKL